MRGGEHGIRGEVIDRTGEILGTDDNNFRFVTVQFEEASVKPELYLP